MWVPSYQYAKKNKKKMQRSQTFTQKRSVKESKEPEFRNPRENCNFLWAFRHALQTLSPKAFEKMPRNKLLPSDAIWSHLVRARRKHVPSASWRLF